MFLVSIKFIWILVSWDLTKFSFGTHEICLAKNEVIPSLIMN